MGKLHPVPARPDRHSAGPLPRDRGPSTVLRALPGAAILALALATPGPLRAQLSPFLVQLRGGAVLPSGQFLDGGTGWDGEGGEAPSFGADFTVVWKGRWGWYAGFGQDRFECPPAVCAGEDELVATGFDLGVRALLFPGARVVPWIGGGGLSYRAERHRKGASSTLTRRSWGWEAGAGMYLVLSERVYLNPSGRFRSIDLDREEAGELRVRTVVLDVGLVLAF